MELLGFMVTKCLTLQKLAECFSKELYHITLLPATCESQFFQLSNRVVLFLCSGFFKFQPSSGYVMIYHYDLICISWWLIMLSDFLYVYKPFTYLLLWCPFKSFAYFCSPVSYFKSSLHILDIIFLSNILIAYIFTQSLVCLFSFLMESVKMHKFLGFMKSKLSFFSNLVLFCPEILFTPRLWSFSSTFSGYFYFYIKYLIFCLCLLYCIFIFFPNSPIVRVSTWIY